MTRRYFYTDPLTAAWQAKHFGMRFQSQNSFRDPYGWAGFEGTLPREWASKHVVHPDSLHLLEPKVGDLISMNYGEHGIVESLGSSGMVACGADQFFAITTRYCPLMAHSSDGWVHSFNKIIQRNGKPFHWPECEEV